MDVSKFEPGAFCWADLGTSDADGAKAFYSGLFGWESVDFPMGEAGTYTMLKKAGREVGALYQDSFSGTPPHWNLYVSVPSVDESLQQVAALGGSKLMGPHDVMDKGRMAIIQDPTGAVLSIWQPRSKAGFDVIGEPGAYCWAEIATRDVPAAQKFYTQLFGWGAGGDPAQYVEFQINGQTGAGLMQIDPKWGPVPPCWTPYFLVEQCDAATETAARLGAQILVPPTDVPQHNIRFAMIRDPQGAVLGICS